MALALAKPDTWTALLEILTPGVYGYMCYAGPRVVSAHLEVDYADDSIKLKVTHRLFDRYEIEDNSYKANFRGRVAQALLADLPKDGLRLTVERRSFLVRAARVRKSKPRKARD